MSVDIVIKSFSRDYLRLINLLRSIEKYFSGYRKIYLFLDDEAGAGEFSDRIPQLNLDLILVKPDTRGGYIHQQYFKLNGPKFSNADYLLPLDSDMIFYRTATVEDWFINGKPFIPFGLWSALHTFPPNKIISNVLRRMPSRTHDLGLIIDHLVENSSNYDLTIENYDGVNLIFSYDSFSYELSKNRLHDTWIASVRRVSKNPIDCMRDHYIFSVEGLDYVRGLVAEISQMSFDDAIFDIDNFPTFSEYQIYGNAINDHQFEKYGHLFLEGNDAIKAAGRLPIIKCNTRVDSAYQIYEDVLNGEYENFTNRSDVLSKIRDLRKNFQNEQWG